LISSFVPRLPIDGGRRRSAPGISIRARCHEIVGDGLGLGCVEPRFGFANVTIESVAPVASSVLRLTLTDDSGKRQRGVVFGSERHPLSRQLRTMARRRCHLAARLRGPAHGGRSGIELLIDDAATDEPAAG